jgi:LuxR family maltose regulon positive regulatory protein
MLEAGVLARSGEPADALNRLAQVSASEPLQRTWYEFDALMFATGVAHLAGNCEQEALRVALRWQERASNEGRRPGICRASLLAAIALFRDGQVECAAVEMQRAISIAAPDRLVAPFLEHWACLNYEVERLLETVSADATTGLFVANLRTVLNRQSDTDDVMGRLSGRETEVLDALCRNESNKVIGRHLGVSEHAVKFHVKNIFRKLGVHSREEAVASLQGRM